jgi:hypothetical protein
MINVDELAKSQNLKLSRKGRKVNFVILTDFFLALGAFA